MAETVPYIRLLSPSGSPGRPGPYVIDTGVIGDANNASASSQNLREACRRCLLFRSSLAGIPPTAACRRAGPGPLGRAPPRERAPTLYPPPAVDDKETAQGVRSSRSLRCRSISVQRECRRRPPPRAPGAARSPRAVRPLAPPPRDFPAARSRASGLHRHRTCTWSPKRCRWATRSTTRLRPRLAPPVGIGRLQPTGGAPQHPSSSNARRTAVPDRATVPSYATRWS